MKLSLSFVRSLELLYLIKPISFGLIFLNMILKYSDFLIILIMDVAFL